MLKQLTSLLFILLTGMTASGQSKDGHLLFNKLTAEDGLPHNRIFSIAQDYQGFIWVGSNNGLGRYDGYEFKTYRPNNSTNSISNKSVYNVFPDKSGYLWLYMQGEGINRLNLKTNEIRHFLNQPLNTNSLSNNIVYSIFESSDSAIWFGTNKGLDKFNWKEDRIERYTSIPNTLGDSKVEQIFEDSFDNLWFRSTDSIYLIQHKTNKVISFYDLVKFKGNKPSMVKIHVNHDRLWIYTVNQGVYCYNIETGEINHYLKNIQNIRCLYVDKKGIAYVYEGWQQSALHIIDDFQFTNNKKSNSRINNIQNVNVTSFQLNNSNMRIAAVYMSEDSKGNIWISSNIGLIKYSKQEGVTHYPAMPHYHRFLSDNTINRHFIDKNDVLYLALNQKGIEYTNLDQNKFKLYFANPNSPSNAIAGNSITTIFEDRKGLLWVGCSHAGISIYNRFKQTYTHIPYTISDTSKIIFTSPSTIVEDAEGILWIGFWDGFIARLNPKTLKLEYLMPSHKNYPCLAKHVRKMIIDEHQNIWIASGTHGVVEFNHKQQKFIYHSHNNEINYQNNSFYRTIYKTKDGMIWFGSQSGGLGNFNPTTGIFNGFKNQINNKNSISSNTVYSILEESDSILWVATSSGLNKFNRLTNVFTHYDLLNQKEQCSAYTLIPDANDNLWISSDYGLFKFNKSSQSTTHYTTKDGLPENEFNTTASTITKSGDIYLGLPFGMISFSPTNIKEEIKEIKPTITGIRIFNTLYGSGDTLNNRVLLKTEIWDTKKLELYHNENDFIIEFSALDFANSKSINYSYRMLGYHNQWITAQSGQNRAHFTGLPAGKYTFQVTTENPKTENISNKYYFEIEIIITPPYYQTLWFRIILVVLIIIIAITAYHLRVSSLKKQRIILEELVLERTQAIGEANILLEERQEEITMQNEQLANHRDHLEKEVLQRTQLLQVALKKAKESDDLKNAFLANLSHEVRTPMNSIIGFSNLLMYSDSDEERHHYATIINNNCDALLVLINDIMDISMIEANQIRIVKTNINIVPIFQELEEIFRLKINSSVNLFYQRTDELYYFNTDGIRLRQIVTNLLTNAIKFTENGSVRFGFKVKANYILLYVIDTGIGISSMEKNAIFNYFYRIENNPDKLYRGVGIGLSISKNLVELLGGKIWYHSVENKGTAFFCKLPIT